MAHELVHGYDTLIFDIRSCLFASSAVPKTGIDSRLFKKMTNTQIWYEHEAGTLSDDETYAALAKEFNASSDDIQAAVSSSVEALSSRPEMLDLIRTLTPGRRIYAMANMPISIWNLVKVKGADHWTAFDAVFVSGAMGTRKPELPFYQHILQETGAVPARTIFVDDTRENLVTARSLGIKTILYDSFANTERTLHNLCGDPVARARQFLVRNAKNHLSYTSAGQVIHENFSQLLILEATNDPSLVDYSVYEAEFNFFKGCGEFTDPDYPVDLDTTSMAWTVIPDVADHATKMKVMDRMLQFCDGDGIPLTYFDWNRPRKDHGICVNILALFHAYERGHDLEKAVNWICSVLMTGAYLEGSRYYMGPEPFLYFMLRLLERAPSLEARIGIVFKGRCQERVGSPGDALALAMRLHCCTRANIDNKIDLQRLLDMQELDGGWDGGVFYRFGLIDLQFGNRGLATAIAQRAIQEYNLKFN